MLSLIIPYFFPGWPFTALLGVPIAVDMLLFKGLFKEFIKWSMISLVIILLPTVAVDSWHYGRLVVAPWNIVAYNIFTEHGPDLYGVEPWTYYFVNGFLNFNIVWVSVIPYWYQKEIMNHRYYNLILYIVT